MLFTIFLPYLLYFLYVYISVERLILINNRQDTGGNFNFDLNVFLIFELVILVFRCS